MRAKKRYLLLKNHHIDLPTGARYLFQNQLGYVVKADLEATKLLKKDATLISGSIRKLKHPKALNLGKKKKVMG
jgi:hypothetical protein